MNSEKGQALPLAMMALALGTLVITPFLSHAGSGLIGSLTYGQTIIQQSSCDAGVEHAIWNLTRGGLAEQIPETGDEVTYKLDEKLNGLTTRITVTANVTAEGGGTIGEIEDTIIDTLDFETNGAEPAKIIHVSGNVYAIVYTDRNNDGWVKTVEVAPDGTITDKPLDSFEFENRQGQWTDIIHVAKDIYAIAYRGRNGDGYVKTIQIASNGDINNWVIDWLEFDYQNCNYPVIIQVSADIYAIAYEGNNGDGFVRTIQIASNGDINNWVIDWLEFDNRNGHEPDIIHISGDIYAIAYRGNNNDGYLKTIEITSKGNINNWVIDTFEFNRYECNFPVISNISGDIYVVVYDGDSAVHSVWGGGILTTVEIASDGRIKNSIIDEAVFDKDDGNYPDIIWVGSNVYAIAYTGVNEDGWLKTLTIENDGSMPDSIIDYLEFDTQTGYCPDIINVTADIFAIAYTGTNQWHGILKTVEINTSGGGTSAAYEIVSTAGYRTIRAYVNITGDTPSIVMWQVERATKWQQLPEVSPSEPVIITPALPLS
jgi:hypothetical protein